MSFQLEPGAKPPYLVITMEGGRISSICSPNIQLEGVKVAILEYDNEIEAPSDITLIPQGEGEGMAEALVTTQAVRHLVDKIDADITRITDGEIK